MPAKKRLAVLIAIAAIAAAVAGCGSDEIKGTIPSPDAEQLRSDLDAVEAASANNDCAGTKASAEAFLQDVNELPATSGTALKEALRGAGDNLEQLVQEPCGSGATGATGKQPTGSTSEETTTPDTTAAAGTTSTNSRSTTAPSEPTSPPGGGNGSGLGNGNGQGNGNPGAGNPGGGSTGGTGGTGVGGG